ncbi:MAG TPA: hypothetical protein VHZ09_18020 [Acidobacteriaceae bacterium]|jgi:hypothetical protein|nr:hypothetical protein [Acidobacteriaceae bacterium]
MPDSATGGFGRRGKDPDFLKVVIAAMIVTLVFFLGAWLIVMHSGRSLLPRKQHQYNPHAALRLPDVAPITAA